MCGRERAPTVGFISIVTTIERAKELRKIIEPLVALARVDSVNNRRAAASQLYTKSSLGKLFTTVGPKNATRPGGYTRILKLGFRPGDHARRAIIEFVDAVPAEAVAK